MALQLLAAMGPATVVAVDQRPAALALAKQVGAHHPVTSGPDAAAEVREITRGRGADVVLDLVGAKYLQRNVEVLAPNGRLVVIGLQGGTRAELDLGLLLRKRAAVLATALRSRPPEEKAAIVSSVRENVWPLITSGAVRPVVDRVLPMSEAGDAHRVLEAGENVGKILLRV
jgi:NADPH:quinone reductase-like Zn-dependent oxidoreductase